MNSTTEKRWREATEKEKAKFLARAQQRLADVEEWNRRPPAPPVGAVEDALWVQYQEALFQCAALAYAEGKEGRDHDTLNGDAAECLRDLRRIFRAALSAPPADPDWSTPLTPELQAYLHDKHVGAPAQPTEVCNVCGGVVLLTARPATPAGEPEGWQPQFDATSVKQEDLVRQFCAEIAGPRGQPGCPPDPVRLLEMAQALYEAERDDLAPSATQQTPTDAQIMAALDGLMVTGENQNYGGVYRYRSVGTPSHVTGPDLLTFARRVLALSATQPAGEAPQ